MAEAIEVLFVVPEPRIDEYLGVGSLSAALAAQGIRSLTLQWAIEGVRDQLAQALEAGALLVGIPWLYIFSEPHVLAVARFVKKSSPEVHVVVGGHPATFEHKRILTTHPEIDYVVLGEGDESLIELHAVVRQNARPLSVAGLAFRSEEGHVVATPPRPQIPNIDVLPPPSRDTLIQLLDRFRDPERVLVRMIASRGCYARCEFCSMVSFYSLDGHGMRWRPRRINHIFDEISELVDTYHVRKFWFADDEFIGPPSVGVPRLLDFAALVRASKLDIEWGFDARANGVTAFATAELKQLRESGLRVVAMGLESGSQAALDRMNKGMLVETNREAISRLRDAGIDYRYGFITFDAKASPADIRANLDFLRFAQPHRICNSGPFRVLNAEFPEVGTPLYRRLGLEGHRVDVEANADFPRVGEAELGYQFADQRVSHYRRRLLAFAASVVEPCMVARRPNEPSLITDVWYGVNNHPRNVAVMDAFLGCLEWLLDRIDDIGSDDLVIFERLEDHFRRSLGSEVAEWRVSSS